MKAYCQYHLHNCLSGYCIFYVSLTSGKLFDKVRINEFYTEIIILIPAKWKSNFSWRFHW